MADLCGHDATRSQPKGRSYTLASYLAKEKGKSLNSQPTSSFVKDKDDSFDLNGKISRFSDSLVNRNDRSESPSTSNCTTLLLKGKILHKKKKRAKSTMDGTFQARQLKEALKIIEKQVRALILSFARALVKTNLSLYLERPACLTSHADQ